MEKRILIICGTGIATSTVVGEKIKEIAEKENIKVDINQAKVSEAVKEVENSDYDFLVSTTSFSGDVDLPVINATPIVTGIGEEEVEAEIKEQLNN